MLPIETWTPSVHAEFLIFWKAVAAASAAHSEKPFSNGDNNSGSNAQSASRPKTALDESGDLPQVFGAYCITEPARKISTSRLRESVSD
jgi:hypothetical protein